MLTTHGTELYVLSMLVHKYSIIIDQGVVEPGHGKDIADFINNKYNIFLSMLMTGMKLSSITRYDT